MISAFDDSPRVGAAYGTARTPAPAPDEWYDARSDAGYGGYSDNVDFSVAAIRAKRMRRPAGTHKPTSMATKATVFSLASVCLVAAGVSLGLYGQDMKYIISNGRSRLPAPRCRTSGPGLPTAAPLRWIRCLKVTACRPMPAGAVKT
jgi:hypothetical protein